MISPELITTLQQLSRADKLYIMQVLISALAQQEPPQTADLIKPDRSYPVWSPYDAVEAADAMLKALQAAQAQNHAER